MAKIKIKSLAGKEVGDFELLDEVFTGVNEALLWEAVKHYRASLRQGTHATKNRKLVSGAGKKLWKQKGTGRARDPYAAVAWWWNGSRTATAQLRLPVPEEEAAGCAALGAGFEAGRWQADRR